VTAKVWGCPIGIERALQYIYLLKIIYTRYWNFNSHFFVYLQRVRRPWISCNNWPICKSFLLFQRQNIGQTDGQLKICIIGSHSRVFVCSNLNLICATPKQKQHTPQDLDSKCEQESWHNNKLSVLFLRSLVKL